ncbi:hypothetical protein BDW74DRAFT_177913 [Aspergillus multicolor]|uniref:uncharacterized protein n=1 Tax=Aspergillus multicolor TaxID=41759 RepID=UPI003CCCF515
MKFILSLVAGFTLATMGYTAAVPQSQAQAQSGVTIFPEPNYAGQGRPIPIDENCQTISPGIRSVEIPQGRDVYCTLFESPDCTVKGHYGNIYSSVAEFYYQYSGIVCGIETLAKRE